MLRIEMLPAHHGDALLIEYGSTPRRILIDGGTPHSFDAVARRLARIGRPARLDLMVVTHVDDDHIGGSLALLMQKPKVVAPRQIWFNAYKHLFPPDQLGAAQGEGLTTAIERAGVAWNTAFGHNVVAPKQGELPTVRLGGATITILSPTWPKLEAMRKVWVKACTSAHLLPGEGAEPSDVLGKRPPPRDIDVEELVKVKFRRDSAPANGSSIAFLFEYDGKRLLLTGDAHPDALISSIDRLGAPLSVDVWKISHHGSRANTSSKLLETVACRHYLISTNGDSFGHPDPEAIARIVKRPGRKTIHFNYDTDYTRPWADSDLREQYDYEATYPVDDGHLALEHRGHGWVVDGGA